MRESGDGDERGFRGVEGETFRLKFSFGSGEFELTVESHLRFVRSGIGKEDGWQSGVVVG